MGIEIERKYLLINEQWRELVSLGDEISQGYLTSTEKGHTSTGSVRVRKTNNKAWINIKSPTLGISRSEYEYEIPATDADEILQNLCAKPLISKVRYKISIGQHVWEIDEFTGDNQGLIVAEIELASVEESFVKPEWVGKEVSDDARYYNNCLVNHPYCDWTA